MQPYALTLDKFLAHAAKWHPDAEVVTGTPTGSTRIGYAALDARARRVSAVLQRLGVQPGDHVATLAWNSQAHMECWYGIIGIGAVCHTLNPRLLAPQLVAMLQQSAARVLVVSASLAALAAEVLAAAGAVGHVLVVDGAAAALAGMADCAVTPLDAALAATPDPAPWGGFAETAPCGLCFTSGTTGSPKGVTYTHRSSYLHTLRLLQADVMAITSADAVLAAVPMFHANGWGLPYAAPAVGAKLVLPGRDTGGAHLAQLIEAENVTIAIGVPAVWLGLVEHLEASGGDLPSLRRVVVGGAPMPAALMARLEQRLGASVQTTWGMTELSPLGTSARPDDPERRAQFSGRPAVGIDLRLVDADGRPLPAQRGHEGHLQVRGPAVVGRYFGAATDATVDGWFATGDLAEIDAGGRLAITGRAKDLIKSGGEWINPVEIEALVGALPEVALAAVIGRPHPRWTERPVLLVELRAGAKLDDDALLAPLRGHVASWWIPDAVIRIPRMPLAATGKIDKLRLRSEYGSADAGPDHPDGGR